MYQDHLTTMNFYSKSTELAKNQHDIEQHRRSSEKGYFVGKHGQLFYTYHLPQHTKYTVILVSGRVECAWKYQELLWELAQNNIAVFTFDHIGQGLSARLTDDRQIGYIPEFSDYSEDLNTFINAIVLPNRIGNLFFLGHSMGAAICCDYLSRYSSPVSGSVLCAPMFKILTHSTPYWAAKFMTKVACKVGQAKHFAYGQQPYQPKDFAHNDLTHSQVRYDLFRELYKQHAELTLGGVSYGWLNTVMNFTDHIKQLSCTQPIHILSASQDNIVCNKAHITFQQARKLVTLDVIEGAKHELLCEKDSIRKKVMHAFYEFCDNIDLYQSN